MKETVSTQTTVKEVHDDGTWTAQLDVRIGEKRGSCDVVVHSLSDLGIALERKVARSKR